MNITKKKQVHRFREQISGYQWGEGRVDIGVGKWQVQTARCKRGYENVLHNMGDI